MEPSFQTELFYGELQEGNEELEKAEGKNSFCCAIYTAGQNTFAVKPPQHFGRKQMSGGVIHHYGFGSVSGPQPL